MKLVRIQTKLSSIAEIPRPEAACGYILSGPYNIQTLPTLELYDHLNEIYDDDNRLSCTVLGIGPGYHEIGFDADAALYMKISGPTTDLTMLSLLWAEYPIKECIYR